MNITFSYARVPTIRKFALSNARVRALMGPFGSGKSSGCLWEIIRRSLNQTAGRDGIRKTRWAIVRNTYPQLRDTTIKTVLEWLPESVFGQYKIADHEYIITGFEGCKIEFLFRALDKPEHVDNLLSLELTGAWLNEVREIPVEIVDAIDGRIDRFPSMKDGGCTWAGIIMDTNPPDDQHWFYERFELKKIKGWEVFKQPSGLSEKAENLLTHEEYLELKKNPNANIVGGLPPDYYLNLAAGKSQDFIDVYVHGNYGYLKEGKPIYEKSFNTQLHVSQTELRPIMNREIIIGMDFGLTPAAVILQQTLRGAVRVLMELESENMGIEKFTESILIPHLKLHFPTNKAIIIGDPAGVQRSDTDEKTCFDVLADFGFKVFPAKSNSLSFRLGAVEYFLNRNIDGSPAFMLDPSCKTLHKGFVSGYVFKKQRGSGGYSDVPLKNRYSHIHDALQYGCSFFYEGMEKKKVPIRALKKVRKPASSLAGY